MKIMFDMIMFAQFLCLMEVDYTEKIYHSLVDSRMDIQDNLN